MPISPNRTVISQECQNLNFRDSIYPVSVQSPLVVSSITTMQPLLQSSFLSEISKKIASFASLLLEKVKFLCFSIKNQLIWLFKWKEIEVNHSRDPESLRKIYWKFGKENKWREAIDGCYHYLGKYVFDLGLHKRTIELGFIESMEKAFDFVALSLGVRVTASWYLQLQKYTCGHFKGAENGVLMGQEKVGVFRSSDDQIQAYFASGVYEVKQEAIDELNRLNQELKDLFGDGYQVGEFIYSNAEKTSMCLKYYAMSSSKIGQIFDKFFSDFYQEIEIAMTEDDKLLAIAKLHQRLEWLHPLRDGTSRTSIAVLNKLLTENGFHPVILEYPHVSSSYGLQQWKEYLKSGLLKWELTYPLLNYTTS